MISDYVRSWNSHSSVSTSLLRRLEIFVYRCYKIGRHLWSQLVHYILSLELLGLADPRDSRVCDSIGRSQIHQ